MFALILKLVFSFLVYIIRRSAYGLNKLFLRKRRCEDLDYSPFSSKIGNPIKENICNVDHYVLQDKGTEFLFKLGLFNINGNIELNGKVTGLKNIKETRHVYYYKKSALCTMAEFEASELSIDYDGIVRLSCIAPVFFMRAILKNVKVLIEFQIYPFERITFNLNDVEIDEFKINASVSGLNAISKMITLIVNITLNLMHFPILCFVEFYTKCYLNKAFSKFYLTQSYVLEKARKSMIKYTSALTEPCIKAEIEIARQISRKSEYGPTSFFYNFLTGWFEFNKDFNKVTLAAVFKENFKDFLNNVSLLSETFESDASSSQSSESDSDTSLISSDFCGFNSAFDDSGIRGKNWAISSSDTESDSSSSNESNNETLSTLSDTSSENEIVHQPENDSYDESSIHLDKSYNECESESENDTGEDNLRFEGSPNERKSHSDNDSGEDNIQFEEGYNNYMSPSDTDSGGDNIKFEESHNKCKSPSDTESDSSSSNESNNETLSTLSDTSSEN